MTYVIWPAMAEMAEKKLELEEKIMFMSGHKDFNLVPVIAENWNDDLSPWEFKDQKNVFMGKADAFLEKILATVNQLSAGDSDCLIIAGYSLAGLFSLWTASMTDIFDGVASCSGSLWFPGFSEKCIRPKCSAVYLSLGDKESSVRHPLMQKVGEVTGEYAEKLESSGLYKNIKYELNPGNHFCETNVRLARGISFLLNSVKSFY